MRRVVYLIMFLMTNLPQISQAQMDNFVLHDDSIYSLYYLAKGSNDNFLINYLIKSNDSLYLFNGIRAIVSDSNLNLLIKYNELQNRLNANLLNKNYYYNDVIFKNNYLKDNPVKINKIDTFKIQIDGIYYLEKNNRQLLVKFVSNTSNKSIHFGNLFYLNSLKTSCGTGTILKFYYGIPDTYDANSTYYYLNEFWIIRYKGDILDYIIDRVNNTKFNCAPSNW